MAGTDTSQPLIPADMPLAPVVILVRPQLGENIGMCARAMLNCGVTELRIVEPRDGWPNDDAIAAASGAIDLLQNARLYASTAEATADLEYVLATTARMRGMAKPVLTADEAAREIHHRHHGQSTARCGILFGPERSGLENDDVAVANAILNIPLNPGFSSLNLAQAVLLACYSWLCCDNRFPAAAPPVPEDGDAGALAPRGDIENFLHFLERDLEAAGFFRSPPQRPTILRNIRNFFFRSAPTIQEVRTLQGILVSLRGKPRGSKAEGQN
ncbi:MAG: RNA methyltransferase [Bdellovibrionales bacterium]|jgi:tRNA/rRNA methyltransferase|nr:RNA methyltransferase [Bdellovibrionales bacterium]